MIKLKPARREQPVGSVATPTGGAVYVEFLVAFLPMFLFFLSLIQFIFINIASVLVKHAAIKGVRAAVVVIPDDPTYYDSAPGSATGKRKSAIEHAVRLPLSGLGQFNPNDAKVSISGSGRDAQITVKVDYTYDCQVPWGRWVCCGFNTEKKITAQATLPNHGADYTYGPGSGFTGN